MKPYLLRNDDIQHAQRIFLVKYYQKKRGRPVPFVEILHDLMEEESKKLGFSS